jgi:hypothetical protein
MAGGTIDNTMLYRLSLLNNSSRGIQVHNQTTVTNLLVEECNFENTNIGLRVSSSGHLEGVKFLKSDFLSAVIGQVYLTVLVARLVGLHLQQKPTASP